MSGARLDGMAPPTNDLPADLLAAAKFERDRRAEKYPARIAAHPEKAEALCIDYQCWVAIAEWLETDRFYSFAGGANPEAADAPIVKWPELETAAAQAVQGITAKLDRLEQQTHAHPEEQPSEDRPRLEGRRANLNAIHRKVQLQRQTIDSINAEFRRSSESAERRHEFRKSAPEQGGGPAKPVEGARAA